jgi:hypothetical protein
MNHVIFALILMLGVATSVPFNIQLKHNSAAERATREQLERLLAMYDVSKYTYTRDITIEERAIPHSHPVLTLNTRNLGSDDQLLSAFLHEQLHWYLDAHKNQTEAAVIELRQIFPNVPVGYPDGAVDEQSTYEHLIDCYLELQADRILLGEKRADAAVHAIGQDHYRWIYSTIFSNETSIAEVIEKHHLDID